MNTDMKRALISVVILFIIYFAADLIIGPPAYDAGLKSIHFLAAVLAAGCYWIGSNKK